MRKVAGLVRRAAVVSELRRTRRSSSSIRTYFLGALSSLLHFSPTTLGPYIQMVKEEAFQKENFKHNKRLFQPTASFGNEKIMFF